VVVVATPEHHRAFQEQLRKSGIDVIADIDSGQLVMLDAREQLARFMVDGHPDSQRFNESVGRLIREASALANGNELRVYGEMVGLLWKQQQFPAAIRLEQ